MSSRPVPRVARCVAAWAGLVVAIGGAPALAQSTGVAADRLVPALGPSALIGLEGGSVTPRGQISLVSTLGWLARPIVLEGRLTGREISVPVRDAITTDVAAEVGVTRRLALGLGVPVTWWARGDRLRGTGVDEGPLGSPRGGDLRLRAKAALIDHPGRVGLHAALSLVVTIPMGGQADFAATDGVTVTPRLHLDFRTRWFAVAVGFGVRLGRERWLFESRLGDELQWAVGVISRPLALGRALARVVLEAEGAVVDGGQTRGPRPAELRGAVRIGGAWFDVDVGAGGGLVPELGAPSERVFVAFRCLLAPVRKGR